jgi:general secretion pathway protein F
VSTGLRSFSFDAVRPDGGRERGLIWAGSREEVTGLIRKRGAFAVNVREATAGNERGGRMTSSDLAVGLRSLAALLGAGLPVSRALEASHDLVPTTWRPALGQLNDAVARGMSVADALETSTLSFSPDVLAIIRAGEQGSGLQQAVERAADLLEARAADRAALVNALTYPSILAVAGSASVGLLVVVVLPRFVSLVAESGQPLPWPTRLLLGLGGMAPSLLIFGLVAAALAMITWRGWMMRDGALQRWHHFLLTIPVVGSIRHAAATARACSTMAALLSAGVPLTEALGHAGAASGDGAVAARLAAARRRLLTGEALSAALIAERALTATVGRMVRIGEETGELAVMVGHAGRIEAESAVRRVQRLIRLLEPAMIVVFGGVVMLVAAALLQAMYGFAP